MSVFFGYLFPLVFGLFLVWFLVNQTEEGLSRITALLISILAFIPGVNWVSLVFSTIVVIVFVFNFEITLKETKFNKYWFNKYFDD